jgi:dipeptidyl aminopeptidase/acylaminoacyl peptidase
LCRDGACPVSACSVHPQRPRRRLLHGSEDDTIPPQFSRDYVEQKKKKGESVQLLEIPHAGHSGLIEPTSEAFRQVTRTVLAAVIQGLPSR